MKMPSDPIEWRHKPSTTLDIQLLAEGPQPHFVCGTTLLRCGVEVIYCWIKTQVTQVTSWYRWTKNKTNKKNHKTIQEQWLIFFPKGKFSALCLKNTFTVLDTYKGNKNCVYVCWRDHSPPPPPKFCLIGYKRCHSGWVYIVFFWWWGFSIYYIY